jgi:hypothetical protein|tara:strand:- start:178 stop:315 length:138 start_codon:yes stop_codon:yes gene_type:complete
MGEKMNIIALQVYVYVVLWLFVFIAMFVGSYNELTNAHKRDKESE